MSGEDDGFNSKNWVWVPDATNFFNKGYITDYLDDGKCKVTVIDGNQEVNKIVESSELENCNPQKFNKCNDMAELTHLNEPSVVYNLYLRYNDDMIYTYSGLFLVAINPYKSIPIYDSATLKKFHDHDFEKKEENTSKPPPHIYATAEGTYRNLLENQKDQSILVTGESGAGKTENTKKIIQYLSSITGNIVENPSSKASTSHTGMASIDTKILQANPILESFGNAKTIKNNNSSRFGKFIKIFVSTKGSITGANIEYYLLEKSRVVHQVADERNYHIFYQFLKGSSKETLDKYKLSSSIKLHSYLKLAQTDIPKTDDSKDFKLLVDAFDIMGFEKDETNHIFSMLAVILHLGNLDFTSFKAEQASFTSLLPTQIISELLGIKKLDLVDNLLKPKVKAGKEFISKAKKAPAVRYAVDAFAKYLYEKVFQYIIDRINANLRDDEDADSSLDGNFIGVLDIAGFEIFEQNSFEQLCINYTNEKLQQFFNHHSFILEQSEYLREDIQWEFIDFGQDLQPTIDLIETRKPMGIFAVLDEECMVPKSSDKIFMEKLASKWGNGENKKFQQNKFKSGFIVHHYAGKVEYNVENWLQKNTDPVTESLLKLFPQSSNQFVQDLFKDDEHLQQVNGGRNGKLKTASQKHKDQLSNLMNQLGKTEPHFVRCILPNLEKKPNKFDKKLVLHQLRCNGVLEGIRIARAGYPNKMTFEEFYQRYTILDIKEVFTKNLKTNSELIIKHINLDVDSYKIGITKLFFKNGVLGKLEELRDLSLKGIFTLLQSVIRGKSTRTHIKSQIDQIQASQLIARNFRALSESMKNNLWLELFINIKPLLEDSVKVLDSKEINEKLKTLKSQLKDTEKLKEKLEQENVKLKEQITHLEDDIISTNLILQQRDTIVDQMKQEEKDKKIKIDSMQNEIKAIKKERDHLQDEKTKLDKQLEKHKTQLETNLEKLKSVKDEHSVATKQLEKLTSKLTHHEQETVKHKEVIEQLMNETGSHKEILENLKKEHEVEILKSTNELQANSEKYEKMKSEFESTIESHELKLKSLETQLQEQAESSASSEEELKLKYDSLVSTHESIKLKLEKSEEDHAQLREEHSKITKERDSLSNKHVKSTSEHQSKINLLTTKVEELTKLLDTIKATLKDEKKASSEKDTLLSTLQGKLSFHESEAERIKSDKSTTEQELISLKSELEKQATKILQLQEDNAKLNSDLSKAISDLESHKLKEQDMISKHAKEVAKLDQIEVLKKELVSINSENTNINSSFQKLRVELEGSKSTQDLYSKQILDLKEKVKTLETEKQLRDNEDKKNKENIAPPSDPNFVNEFATIKLKLNEQSATLRKEKFENQKLSEELKQLKSRIGPDGQLKKLISNASGQYTPNRRSFALGELINIGTLGETSASTEIESLKRRIQQEESNTQRAETYAIELQKKLNKLQTTRGISNSWNIDYEKKYKESQERIQELETKFQDLISLEDSPKRLAKSESFGRSSVINNTLNNANQDFVKIYQDITKTLKVTRDELTASKSEILRLKHLLRELEDELYETKKSSFKSSVTEYENELAQLKVKHESIRSQNVDLNSNIEVYKRRADEYYQKLELAESAIKISKRHEEQATKELSSTKTQLNLAREESRATQILIKETRLENSKLETTINDKEYSIQQLQYQIKNLNDKINYFTKNYENVENQEKLKDEIRDLRKDLNFKLETETTLIRDNKKLSLDLEELTEEKNQLDIDFEQQAIKLEELELLSAELTNKCRTLENEKQLNERKINNFTKQVLNLKELVKELTEQKDGLLQDKDKLEEDLLKLTHTHEDTLAKLSQTESDMAILRTHLESQRQDADDIRSEFRQSKISTSHDIQDYLKLKKELLVTSEENDSLKKVNVELNSKVQILEDKLYSNEQLKYWETKVEGLSFELDKSHGENYEANKTIKQLERDIKKLEIRVTNESQLSKKYNDENFDFQNKVNHYKSTVDILHTENLEKDLQLKASEREKEELKENMLFLEKEVLELRARLGV